MESYSTNYSTSIFQHTIIILALSNFITRLHSNSFTRISYWSTFRLFPLFLTSKVCFSVHLSIFFFAHLYICGEVFLVVKLQDERKWMPTTAPQTVHQVALSSKVTALHLIQLLLSFFEKSRYNWYIFTLGVQHNDLMFVHIAECSPQ